MSPPHPPGPTPWWKQRTLYVVAGAFLAVVLLATAGWALIDPGDGKRPVEAAAAPTTSASASPTAAPTTDAPTPSPTAAQPPPQPVVTHHPVPQAPPPAPPPVAELPPAPVPQPPPNPTCTPTFNGTNASKTQVRDALVAAGNHDYWAGVTLPSNYQGARVPFSVPANLMKAIAWQESGWQSAIVACDGGIGTMQLMTNTVGQINQRFDESYNPNTLDGNTKLGANYIEWLVMYFGTGWFGQNFDLSLKAPIGPNGAKLSLLDVVVSAYNVGPGTLQNLDNPADTTLTIPNWQYVNNVEALMSNCECLAF
jgi:hypothetical protein